MLRPYDPNLRLAFDVYTAMRSALAITFALLLSGCPTGQSHNGATANGKKTGPALRVALLRSDLGIEDGELVREADTALSDLAKQGGIKYTPVGDLPNVLEDDAGTGDIGLPGAQVPPGGKPTGLMTSADAAKLAEQLPDCDVVVAATPVAARPVLARIQAGKLHCGAVLVLEDSGPKLPKSTVPVITVSYDIKEAAYLLGVATGVSSRSQSLLCLTSTLDPSADTLLQAFSNGAHYRMRGAVIYHQAVTPSADDIVAPEDYSKALKSLLDIQGMKTNHYIVFLGRATPSIMDSLSSKPTDGFLLGGYGDLRAVRPARVVGCIVKHPAPALKQLFSGAKNAGEVAAKAKDGKYAVGFKDGSVDVTDFTDFGHYRQEADDIAAAVKDAREQILGGDIDVMER